MNSDCLHSSCLSQKRCWKIGSYVRKSDSKIVHRWRCPKCKSSFSEAQLSQSYRQHKRRINPVLVRLLSSGVSMRRSALILGVNRKTVSRKLEFLSSLARLEQRRFLMSYENKKVTSVQFDDLETIEHTKCKPLSVSLAVEEKTRKILAFEVSVMPAKGRLAEISRVKYGVRPDERGRGLERLFKTLSKCVDKEVRFLSDQNPLYPKAVRNFSPRAVHNTVKGQRGCVAGQGELKKVVFDPLFSLNHCCAMLRANISRLIRKTWCTTKKIKALENHLAVYINFHNQILTSFQYQKKGPVLGNNVM